jgi:NADH:ubiquinone oxidoreductase subunit E
MAGDAGSIQEDYMAVIQAYPEEKRYILAMMQDLQRQCNYLPREALEQISRHVDAPFSKVYAMATFYKAFSLVPKGKYAIKVCDGTACHIKSSAVLIDQIYSTLGIKPGETAEDGLFSLETVNCIGACAIAPVVVINGKVYSKVSSAGIVDIIRGLEGRQENEADN